MAQKTLTTVVWLTDSEETPIVRDFGDERLSHAVTISSVEMEHLGWVRIGTASVTIDDPKDVDQRRIELLEKKIAHVQATAQNHINRLSEQIMKLKAIGWSGSSEG